LLLHHKLQNGLAKIQNLETPSGEIIFPQYFPGIKVDNNDLTKNLFPKYKSYFTNIMINISDLLSSRYAKKFLDNNIHDTLKFNGVIFSDSGGFTKKSQNFSQKVIIENQINLGVDIATTLDQPIRVSKTWHNRERILVSINNAIEASNLSKNFDIILFGSVHGRSSDEIISVIKYLEKKGSFHGYAIGSLIPITGNIRYVVNLILKVRRAIPHKPIHVYGLTGYGLFHLLFYLGISSVDSHGYLLHGVRRYYFIPGKNTTRLNQLKQDELLPCVCPICKDRYPREINHRVLIAMHNYLVLKHEVNLSHKMIQQEEYRSFIKDRLLHFPFYQKEIKYIDRKLLDIF